MRLRKWVMYCSCIVSHSIKDGWIDMMLFFLLVLLLLAKSLGVRGWTVVGINGEGECNKVSNGKIYHSHIYQEIWLTMTFLEKDYLVIGMWIVELRAKTIQNCVNSKNKTSQFPFVRRRGCVVWTHFRTFIFIHVYAIKMSTMADTRKLRFLIFTFKKILNCSCSLCFLYELRAQADIRPSFGF